MSVHDHAAATERVAREPLHTRQITFEGFRRSDGLFEIEGYLTDRKPHDFAPPSSPRVVPANEPIHDLGLRVVFDLDMIVHEVETFIRAYPYRECPGGGATLQALVGCASVRAGAARSASGCRPATPVRICVKS